MPLPVGFQSDIEGFYIYKDKDAIKRYVVDWTKWLDTDNIVSVVWEVPSNLTRSNEYNNEKLASIILGGGAINKAYIITCRINTNTGQTEDQSFRLVIPDAS